MIAASSVNPGAVFFFLRKRQFVSLQHFNSYLALHSSLLPGLTSPTRLINFTKNNEMKKLIFLAGLAIASVSFAQTTANTVPESVLTDDSTYWSISTISTISYVNTTPGANYNTYKNGGGMIVKFKFKENNRFEFLLYVQANTYGIENEAWTQCEGTVEFTKDSKNQNVFITHAERGTYRTTRNGNTSTRPIPESDLKTQHSNTYLWEKTTLKDDPNNIYLLMIDLDAHPQADINNPKTIDPSWVSKFHIPAIK